MPNKKAAIKSLRQDKKKHDSNKAELSEIRTITKKARVLIAADNSKEADTLLKKLESKLGKAAKNDVIKKNNAARRISRLRSQWARIGS
ncbi:MAG: 30S ribosomal protein S20 [Candidatus Omnitrophica bacterium]|nr:30S ribosomal protein S20 [Candidatus Omnitrophota bacterium]